VPGLFHPVAVGVGDGDAAVVQQVPLKQTGSVDGGIIGVIPENEYTVQSEVDQSQT
jgi:hypothetical protein